MTRQKNSVGVCLVFLMLGSVSMAQDQVTVKVFLLAGQSNMQGQGVVDLDHPKYYNGGKGILKNVIKRPETADRYQHLVDERGEWTQREDVFVRFQTGNGLKKGPLSIGFAGYEGRHHIGPELQFGHVVGDAIDEPVLLIKTAWGGKSLYQDFRPPSAEGETGAFYTQMLAEYRDGIREATNDFPQWKGAEFELAGFVWFQGWNDLFDEQARGDYQENLVYLIQDVRREFENPNLPVVIGELGNGGRQANDKMLEIRAAQQAAAEQAKPTGRAVFVKTAEFARPAEESPNTGHGHHWFGNAESYFLIGDALGNAMVELLSKQEH